MIKHEHLIVRVECDKIITCPEETKIWLKQLVSILGMKIVSGPHTAYVDIPGNRGITGVVIIETSHVAIHCWDEQSPQLLQLDVYSCATVNINDVLKHLAIFKPTKIEYKFLDREHGLKIIQEL